MHLSFIIFYKLFIYNFSNKNCFEIDINNENFKKYSKRIAVDTMFPPPDINYWPQSKKNQAPEYIKENNKFDLVFDEIRDGPALKTILQKSNDNKKKISFFIYYLSYIVD